MDRREILNELAQIVALTDPALRYQLSDEPAPGEAAHRVKSLIREVESWPTAFPPAPFVSDQCAAGNHTECQLRSANLPITRLCQCRVCHCPPEAPQQPVEPAPATARHIDTPDELLELLAGVSSDPQIEGLSLAQKASTMALLHIANELHAGVQFQREAIDYLMDKTVATMAPQPMRIYVKHSRRRRVPEACTSEQAAEAQEMARKIVKESEVGSPEDETAKTVTIALMLRRWKYGDDALQDPDTPQQPS